MAKIFAIGGGGNGRYYSKTEKSKYEIKNMDEEIIRLTGKTHPVLLFLAQAQPLDMQRINYEVIKENYEALGATTLFLDNNDLENFELAKEYFDKADIIFETGGNTVEMIEIWKKNKIDILLKEAFDKGKVLSGVSAGANCWFKHCSTDSNRIAANDFTLPLTMCECLNFLDGFFVPHADSEGREETSIEFVKELDTVGILISNYAALEIVDDKYRVFRTLGAKEGFEPYGLKIYFKDGILHKEYLKNDLEFRDLKDLLSK